MNHNGDQWKGAHAWKPAENSMGQKVERSETPHGVYTVSGHGAGKKMKWSAHRNLNEDTNESEWEVMGSTRRDVRAEADLNLRGLLNENGKDK